MLLEKLVKFVFHEISNIKLNVPFLNVWEFCPHNKTFYGFELELFSVWASPNSSILVLLQFRWCFGIC